VGGAAPGETTYSSALTISSRNFPAAPGVFLPRVARHTGHLSIRSRGAAQGGNHSVNGAGHKISEREGIATADSRA
jgi:hypothetical protein